MRIEDVSIVVNGVSLTEAEVLVVHVALNYMSIELHGDPDNFGDDPHRREICAAYLYHIAKIQSIYCK